MNNPKETQTKFFTDLYQYCSVGKIEFRFKLGIEVKQFFIDRKNFSLPSLPKGKNCYFGVATRDGKGGKKENILEVPALWIDVDWKNTTTETVSKKIKEYPLQPSFVVGTGGGQHIYWLLKEPATKDDIPQVENLLDRLADYFGGDPNATDASRVLRIPGSLNVKAEYNPPREVKLVLSHPDLSYELDDFDQILPPLESGHPNQGESYNPTEQIQYLMENCTFLQHCDKDRATLPEPEWFVMVTQFARKAGGPSWIHSLSRGYPKYDSKETDQKILHAINDAAGPHSCHFIKGLYNCGKNCGVKAPANLRPISQPENPGLFLPKIIDQATIENFQNIIPMIARLKTETEKGIYVERLSKKLNVPKREIQRDLGNLIRKNRPESNETTTTANFPELVDLVLNEAGEVAFLIKTENLFRVELVWEVEGVLYSPPEKAHLPFKLSRSEEVLKRIKSDDDQTLFNDLLVYFKRFSYLLDDAWVLVGCKVFLTYLQDHPDIHYFPEILFWAVPERGKSRTGKSVIYVSFRGIHIVDLREANLFRYSQDLKATLFLDIMDLWKKAERNGCEDILLCRYEKGQRASRVIYPDRGAFKDMVFYEIYGPTLIATNEPVQKILDSRCLPITMPNMPGDYDNPNPKEAQELKERLTAWRARTMGKPLPDVQQPQWLSGRLWDISRPLLQLCLLVSPHHKENLLRSLKEIAGQRLEDKRDTIEGKIMSVLNELSPRGLPEWVIETSAVLDKLNENIPNDRKLTSQWLGRRLKAMGIKTRLVHGKSEMVIKQTDLDLLLYQFGIITPRTPEETLPNSTSLLNPMKLDDYPGRELVESYRDIIETLPLQYVDKTKKKRVVESGRQLGDAGSPIIIDLTNVQFGEVQ